MNRHFCAVPHAFIPCRSSCSPSASFLCLLDEAPTTTVHSQNVCISLANGHHYDILADKAQTIVLALKNINSKAKRDAAEAEDHGED